MREICYIDFTMYSQNYDITPEILKNISSIEAARALIENSPLIPLYERQFKSDAIVRKVHYSTAIEGNYLKLDEVRRVLGPQDEDEQDDKDNQKESGYIKRTTDSSGIDVVARKRDITEVINYRNVVKYIENLTSRSKSNSGLASIYDANTKDAEFAITDRVIKDIHAILMESILNDGSGSYRSDKALTVNYLTGEKKYPYEEVAKIEDKIDALIDWYNHKDTKQNTHPVIKAALLHLELVRIHPFEDGNGRLARSLATLSLSADGYDVNHFFCLDEYYDSNAQDYYNFLEVGFNDITPWLEYFSLGMAIEFNRIKDRVVKISKDARIKDKVGQTFITERQEKIIEWLNNYGYFRNQDFDELFQGISDDTVLRELHGLLDAKIIVKKGKTKSARYELAGG